MTCLIISDIKVCFICVINSLRVSLKHKRYARSVLYLSDEYKLSIIFGFFQTQIALCLQ